jgi:hypothetical protein
MSLLVKKKTVFAVCFTHTHGENPYVLFFVISPLLSFPSRHLLALVYSHLAGAKFTTHFLEEEHSCKGTLKV